MKGSLRLFVLALLAFLLVFPAAAQVKELTMMERLESARKLYFSGSYYAAEKAFMELSSSVEGDDDFDKAEIEAYKVLCAIALDKVNVAGVVKVFCDKYPNAPQQAMVKSALGERYFEIGQYKEALEVFNNINPEHLYRRQINDFFFKKAYSNMRVGNFEEAGKDYDRILSYPYSKYTVPSTYYRGYVYYSQKNFEDAVPLFEQVQDDNRFELLSRYYAVESKFMLKDYDYVISHGEKLFPTIQVDLQNSLSRILSEAYFESGDKEKAKHYMDLYRQSAGQLSRKDYYFSGLLSYNLNSYDAAIESFSHVIGTDDELSQNAYYYSANSYLKNRNKIAAIESFKSAADYDFDPVIKEDAFFNYAKLSFDVNRDITQFSKYMQDYPDSGRGDIINNYMAASYIQAKDYPSAVEALSKIKSPSREASANLQKAAFFSAMQLIGGNGYRSAIPLLEQAKANSDGNKNLDNLVDFWLSECYFRNERFSDAADINERLLSDRTFRYSAEYPMAIYNLAYDYFRMSDFPKAEEKFSEYIENGSFIKRSFWKDASVRLADSYFMQKKYDSAAKLYEDVFSQEASDDIYPAYQSAVSYGNMGRSDKKISILRDVTRNYKSAPLYPQALFELGRTYAQNRQNDNASECFYTLLGMEKDSSFYAKTLMELAQMNIGARKYDKAINCYKSVIIDTPFAPEAQEALSGLETLYQSMNKPEEFLAFIDQMGMSGIKSSDEKEDMIYSAGEKLYKIGRYSAAINSLQRYLSQYPRGSKVSAATYYLAECMRNTGRLETAADTYLRVMKMGKGKYYESAAENYAKINLDLQHYEKAVESYKNLAESATSDEMRNAASLGKMRAFYADKQYSEALKDATTLASTAGLSPQTMREVRYTMAKSYLSTGDRNRARPIFEELAADKSDSYGAESEYILIKNAYDSGDFITVESRVSSFANSGGQAYWLARSILVLGDSYADRGDIIQARETYETVLNGYENEDIRTQAMDRLSALSSQRR